MGFFESAYRNALKEMGRKGRKPSASIKPSSLFCPRKMTFELLQIEPRFHVSPEALLRMEDGKSLHTMIQTHLEKWLPVVCPGWKFQYEVKLTAKNCEVAAALNISCSIDGFGRGPNGERYVLEIKSMGENQMATLKTAKKEHVEQLNMYMYLIGAGQGELLYLNRSNLWDMRSFDYPFDPLLWQQTENKINRVQEAAMKNRLPPTDVNPFWCRDCPYEYRCENRDKWVDASS